MSAVIGFGGREVRVSEEWLDRVVDEILVWLDEHPDAPVSEFEAFINEIIRREGVPWPALLTVEVATALTLEGSRMIVAHTDIGGLVNVTITVEKPFTKNYAEKIRKIVEIAKKRYISK